MYNPLLDTFIVVSDYGSFTKAADELFLSPTAVMKQVNSLERHLGLKLFDRTLSGVKLTKAGEIVYKEAKFMIAHSKKSVNSAINATLSQEKTISIGTSLLNPAKPFMDLWFKINGDFSGYKIRLVPFDDGHDGILGEIEKLGEKFDFLIGVCDSKEWLSRCSFLELGKYKKMVALSREHALAKKKVLKIDDLDGQTLMMVKRGDSAANDKIRDDLEKNHPLIKIEDTPRFYDIEVFNRAAETGNVLLTIECWQDVHPSLKAVPVLWNYDIPYGILYSNNASDDVRKIVSAIEKLKNT